MVKFQTVQFIFLLFFLPLIYYSPTIYLNHIKSVHTPFKLLFENPLFIITYFNQSQTIPLPIKQHPFCLELPSTTSNFTLTITDNNTFIDIPSIVPSKSINVAVCNELISPTKIPEQLAEHYWYSPSKMLISPGVIITHEIINKEAYYDESKEDVDDNNDNEPINLCIHNLSYIQFFIISAFEIGMSMYNLNDVPSNFFYLDQFANIFYSVCFGGFFSTLFLQWASPSKKNISIFFTVCLISLSMFKINTTFVNSDDDVSFVGFSYVFPLLSLSTLFLKYPLLSDIINDVKGSISLLLNKYTILFITLIISLVGSFFTTYSWILILILSSILLWMLADDKTYTTKCCSLVVIGHSILFVYLNMFNAICVIPFVLLLF
ncbi:Intimal thickness related receptor IRP domain-containing protein [Entamoeba marina]